MTFCEPRPEVIGWVALEYYEEDVEDAEGCEGDHDDEDSVSLGAFNNEAQEVKADGYFD